MGRGSAGDLEHRVREKETGERGKVVEIRRSDGVERYNNDALLVEGSRSRLRGFSEVVEACVCGRLFAMVVVRVQGALDIHGQDETTLKYPLLVSRDTGRPAFTETYVKRPVPPSTPPCRISMSALHAP